MIHLPIVHVGVDECGALTADTALFTIAAVLTQDPESLRNVIQRVAVHSGKRLQQRRRALAEFKWRNSSQRFRSDVLERLADSDAKLFALTVNKESRRIADTPENHAVLVCALLKLLWNDYPNVALLLDKHFTSPTQIAIVNTFVYRQWPRTGVLSIEHVDSQRSPLVQLADFVAGCVYAWHRERSEPYNVIEKKLSVAKVESWSSLKAQWVSETK